MNARTYNILVAALGGEGGGVLANWMIATATLAGFPIQSTSVPGVAQRTGATTYYLEMFPRKLSELGGVRPVLSLTPTPGDVDVVVASELVEAGRAMQNGFVTPDRTTLIASTNRVYAIGERMAMADGRFDGERIIAAAKELARLTLLFDMAELARTSGSPVNAVLFGALIASRTLPLERTDAEAAIRRTGKAVESNLKGFALGFDRASRVDSDVPAFADDVPPRVVTVPAEFPKAAHEVIARGIERLVDYQGRWYADLYLQRLRPIVDAECKAGAAEFAVTQETARYLALWMSYEDVIRVAELKTRAERHHRIRAEVRARENDIVRVTDFLKPGIEELCSVMPPGMGRPTYDFARKRGWAHRLNVGMHIRSTSISGFLLLRMLAGLRWWRPYTWRYREEGTRILRWLEAIERAAGRDLALAHEVAACGQIMKGYGDTHARAVANFDLIARSYFYDAMTESALLARAIEAARKAALADPDGQMLTDEIAKFASRWRQLAAE